MFSMSKFYLQDIRYEDSDWASLGKVTAMSAFLERSLQEATAYLKYGYYGPSFWVTEKRVRWQDLSKNLKAAAREADLGRLSDEFAQCAGEANRLLKVRGALFHSVISSDEAGTVAISAKHSEEGWDNSILAMDSSGVSRLLDEFVDCYDWLDACRSALSFAWGRRGAPPDHPRLKEIAMALSSENRRPPAHSA